uniref:Uncharacterized protein n=1 Tax=Zea mays TaxID=4577 RepID=C4J3B6_MAIZE|nr:unknown [Zea mays]
MIAATNNGASTHVPPRAHLLLRHRLHTYRHTPAETTHTDTRTTRTPLAPDESQIKQKPRVQRGSSRRGSRRRRRRGRPRRGARRPRRRRRGPGRGPAICECVV